MTLTIFGVLGLLMLFILLGVHLAVALGTVSFVGVYWMMGSLDIGLSILSTTAYEALRKDVFILSLIHISEPTRPY